MNGACLNTRNNVSPGCSSSSQTVVSGPSAGSSESVPITSSSAQCNQVFSGTAPSGSYVSLQSAGYAVFDSGTLCSFGSLGYFYFQNDCPTTTGSSTLTLSVDIENFSSCSSTTSGLSTWGRIVLGTLIGLAVFFGLTAFCIFRRRRRQAMVSVVGERGGRGRHARGEGRNTWLARVTAIGTPHA